MASVSPSWTFVLTDIQGNVHGEIRNADGREVVVPLNRLPTAKFTIPLHHQLAGTILSTDCLLKCYRWDGINAKKLVFVGPIISAEEQADRDVQAVQVNAAGPFWRLTKRYLGTDAPGFKYPATGTAEITEIGKAVLTWANGIEYTGITANTQTANTPPNLTKIGDPEVLRMANAAELIAQLSASVNGYDFEVVPVEPSFTGYIWPQIGLFNIVPYIGQDRPDVIFEYGSGRANMTGYTRSVGREGMMTRGYSLAEGTSSTPDILTEENVTERTNRGLFEDVMSDGGVSDQTVRRDILLEHLKHRARPREVITITLAPNVRPWPYTDFVVGDAIRARAVVRGTVRFDAMFRIWGATFAVDKNGNETVTLELVMP